MEKNTIITLDDNTKYALLDKVTKNKKKYYFAIKLDKDENPTTEYEIFELEEIEKETYINILEDDEFKDSIFIEFTNNYIKSIENN